MSYKRNLLSMGSSRELAKLVFMRSTPIQLSPENALVACCDYD